nr:hypothetical protein [Tanacetum cinerariifolium]
MQTQTSNTLHNAIMKSDSKDRPPMLAPDKEVPISEGSPVTRTESYMETYKTVSQDIHNQLNAEAEAVQIILTGIDNDIYSTVDACSNACEMWKAIERSQQAATKNRGKAIINSPPPIYDQEHSMVAEDDEMSKDKDIDKLMALISLSFKKIYQPTNNNLRTSSNTSRANQDNSPRINKSTGYENKRIGNVAGARETVGLTVVQKSGIQCYNYKKFGHVARECQKPKRVKDAAYHRENMLLYQELEAHYMYMAQLQEVSLDAADSGPIEQPEQSESIHDTYPIEQDKHNVIIDSLDMSYDREQIDENDDDADLVNERELLASLIEKLKCEIDDNKNCNRFLETSNKVLIEKLKGEIEDFKNKNKSLESSNNRFKEANNKLSETNNLLYTDFKKSQAELTRRNDVEKALCTSRNHLHKKEAHIKLYKTREDKELDKVISLENKVKLEFLKKAQRANPRLYDIGCYNDNLAVMLAPESVEAIRLEKERYFSKRSRLSRAPVNNGNSKESINKQITLLEKRMDESIPWDQKCKSSIELFKIKSSVGTIFDGVERCKETIAKRTYFGHIDLFIKNTIEEIFSQAIRRINAGLEQFHVCLNEEMVADLRYFNSFELEVDSLRSQLETQKTQFLNELDRLSREYYYADHMNSIFGVYTELDEVTNLQCDYLELLEKCKCLEKELSKSKMMSKSFEALQKHDLKAQLQDKGIVISELKKLIEKLKEKYVDAKFEKSSVIRQLNAFKSQRLSILGVIHTTSVSRPQLKSNPIGDRVMRNNSQGKKQDVEDQRRSVKFSNNKTSVTACNDSLKAKTLNVNFVCATCGKCVLNEKHDMYVLKSVNGVHSMTKMPIAMPVSTRDPKCTVKQSVAKHLKKTVASESNHKPRNITRKLYERVSKACS